MYDIYRWDSISEAFTYIDNYKILSFTAASDTYVVQDPNTFLSDGTTYYRCVMSDNNIVL